MDRERVSSIKKRDTYESVKDQGDHGRVFLIGKALSIMGFVPGGQMVNERLYQEIVARLRDAVRRKRPEMWESQTWVLHHEKASRVSPYKQLSGKISYIRFAPSNLFSGISPSRIFPVSQI